MKKILKMLALILLMNNSVFAENKNGFVTKQTIEKKRARYILVNMQQDYVTCYSFYKIGAEYVRKSNGNPSIIKGIEKSSDISLKLVHETGEMMNMSTEKMSSKVKSEINQQLEMIDNDFSNASILLKKYSNQCKNLIEDKKKRISFWKKKASNKFK